MKEILKVEGMSCSGCASGIEKAVGQLAGVTDVKVDLGNKEVAVEFDNQATLVEIKESIEDQGYDLI